MDQSQHGAYGVKLKPVPQDIQVGGKYRVDVRQVDSPLITQQKKLLFFFFAGTLMGWNAEKHEENARIYALNFQQFPNWTTRIMNWVSLPRFNQTPHIDRAVPPRIQLEDLWERFQADHVIRIGATGARYYDLKANIKFCRPSIDVAIKRSCVKLTWQPL